VRSDCGVAGWDACARQMEGTDNTYLLEQFHGPTCAFKDVALQFVGNLFEYLLTRDGGRVTVVGATSGDTGSAAIEGLRGKENVR
jgi:threonine synthase